MLGAASAPTGRVWSLVVALFVALGPLWLGPAMAPLNAALGARTHVCACGMKAGTCGCPECAKKESRLHDAAAREHAENARPILKSTCSDDDDALPSSALPPCVLPASISAVREPVSKALRAPPSLGTAATWFRAPPTPPPKA